jgi:rhamnosyl/mannosyltransferase
MKRFKVLQVNKFYPPVVGGVERVVQDVARGLRDEYEMRVLACDRKGGRAPSRVDGVPVTRAAAGAVVLSMPLSFSFYPWFRRLARGADLIHLHHPFPLGDVAALLDGCEGARVVVHYHSDIVRQKWVMPFLRPVLKAMLRRADRIIVSSSRIRDRSAHLEEVRFKCDVVPYGVELGEASAPGEDFPLPDRDFVLFVGRLVPYKGAEYLVRAMQQIEAPLVIVGDGPLRKRLEALARDLGIAPRVHFLGRLRDARLRHCFSRCRLFVLPSVSPNEAFGLVQLEAMVQGKPVINTDLATAVPEVSLHGVSGLTVPPRDPEALGEAIATLLGDPGMHGRFSRAAAERARDFSMERFLDGTRRVYRELLGEAPCTS